MALLEPEEARAWFERAVEENYRLLYSVAFNVLRSPQAAEDATQEAVLRAYSQLNSLENPQAVAGWLTKITQNVARDMLKKRAPVSVSSLKDQEAAFDREAPSRDTNVLELQERHAHLHAALAKLSPEQTAVVTLRYLEELDIDEIAERLGKKPNAVAALLHRSRTRLKIALAGKRTTRMLRSKLKV